MFRPVTLHAKMAAYSTAVFRRRMKEAEPKAFKQVA